MLTMLDRVSKNYDKLKVVEDLTLTLEEGKIHCIVGPSGCGKSTILNLLANVIEPDCGTVNTKGEKVGYIFQEDRLLPWETVFENIAIVRKNKDTRAIQNIIKNVGLQGFENCYPEELSGGMKQRCSIARGFYYEASILLMDEPFKSLDHDLRISMIKYLLKLWEQTKNTIIFVTHNIDEALLLGHQVMVLSKGPTRPIKQYNINTHHNERDLTDTSLNHMRNEIINLISKINREDVVNEKII
ncbi:ABC transporter ATP-binding protein [Anaeromicrobium sediminis]|uniref:ABC transporter n=1 Tax=Anaeromicrobium sediminis TaxID=1478221 RepID=A0A267MML8_9FIRM|nr:ABC transporter ATP-binding protein [Anaeromicrobium sediminis]PAB60677.1 ABC transporter [Anaeromicrobium sediminis]